MKQNVENTVTIYSAIPYNVISKDLPDYLKNDFYKELGEILEYYNIYKHGAEFAIEGTNGDYVGSDVRYKKCKYLIDKEARFLFSVPPTVQVNRNTAHTPEEKEQATILNDYIAKVFEKTGMADKLVKAAKDCFIGKRVGCILNFDEETGISITFLKSYEFLYERDNAETLTKFIAFYTIIDSSDKRQKRIKKKSYEMKNGVCYSHEIIYDGLGNELEEPTPEQPTEFTYIPAVVILNDGLSNDGKGESEVENLEEFEGLYNKLANSDIDAERKSMNAVRYAIDASAESTSDLSTAPGAFWDIKSNPLTPDPKTAQVGMLEPSMSYSGPLKMTIDRVNTTMHEQLDVPDINSEQLQGVITSGKTLKALYWGLMVRCDEKMLVWKPALTYIVQALLDGAILYPATTVNYTEDIVPDVEFEITVENNYPIVDDETEEKTMDLAEVQAMTMSKKSYMKKWRELTDEEVDEELQQILTEQQLFENSMMPMEGDLMDMSAEDELIGGEEEPEDIGSEEDLTDEDIEADEQSKNDLLAQLDALLKEMGG